MLKKISIFFSIKILISTIAIFIWINHFTSLDAFFNPKLLSFDSLRYNHDAYIFAIGSRKFFGDILMNTFTVLYGGFIYKFIFLHPWFITFFNCLISCLSTFILYKSLNKVLITKKLEQIFFLSQFVPTVIIYESILGKEVFYIAGFKLLFAVIAFIFFSNYRTKIIKILLYLFFIILISLFRPVLIPCLFIVFVGYYLKPTKFMLLTVLLSTIALMTVFSNVADQLAQANTDVPSTNPIMQALREYFFNTNPIFNLFGGLFRFFLYLFYPFPLIIPNFFAYNNTFEGEDKCSILLTICDQLSFWFELFLIFCLNKIKIHKIDYEYLSKIKYLFYSNLCCLIFIAFSFTMIHARYRVFIFTLFFTNLFIVKKMYKRPKPINIV